MAPDTSYAAPFLVDVGTKDQYRSTVVPPTKIYIGRSNIRDRHGLALVHKHEREVDLAAPHECSMSNYKGSALNQTHAVSVVLASPSPSAETRTVDLSLSLLDVSRA